jgi:hypothetical protein
MPDRHGDGIERWHLAVELADGANDVGGRRHRVDTDPRGGPVYLYALNHDLEQARRRILIPNSVPNRSLGKRPDMHPKHHGGRWIRKRSGVQHGLSSAGFFYGGTLLSRLEDKQNGARQLAADLAQNASRSDHGRRVAVGSAGMRDRKRSAGIGLVDNCRGEIHDKGSCLGLAVRELRISMQMMPEFDEVVGMFHDRSVNRFIKRFS